MANQSIIHQNVMRRVKTIHALRAILSLPAAAAILAVISLYIIGREVWVARVFQNMPSFTHIAAFTRFWEMAVLDTRTSVQFLLFVVAASTVFLSYHVARLLTSRPSFA